MHARGLHGLRARAAQQVGEAAERGQRAERPECAALADQLSERYGGGERPGTAAAATRRAGGAPAGRATLQIRLL